MGSEPQLHSKSEKPPVLFHSTNNPDIEVFEPRAEKTRDENEGPHVFATPSRGLAGIFLVESDDSWVQSGAMDGVPYIIISDEKRYRERDKGGVIYSLPSDSFENDPEKGLRELEWASVQAVAPIGKEVVSSALQDMLAHGVKIFFVDQETYRRIQEAPDEGESIMKSLVPYGG